MAKLSKLKNITIKMYDVEAADEGFHTKGYLSMHYPLMSSMNIIRNDIGLLGTSVILRSKKILLRLRNINFNRIVCRLDLLRI